MMARNKQVTLILVADETKDSQAATDLLKEAGLPFLVMKGSNQGEPKPPILLVDRKAYQGLGDIQTNLEGIKRSFSSETHSLALTLGVLRRLNASSSMAAFDDRLRVQKVVYLLQRFGLRTKWGFSWYLRGPYSPGLTHAIMDTTPAPLAESQFDRDTVRAIEKFEQHIGQDPSVTDLEAAASLLFIANQMKEPWHSKDELVNEVLGLKPHLDRSRIEHYALEFWDEINHTG